MDKQYEDRDVIGQDRAGNYYCRHVAAMTAESLHYKSDIAAELAHRDMEIDRLRAALKQDLLADNAKQRDALIVALGALADIGDADREPGDDVEWCEQRAAKALPAVREALSLRPNA